jgi:hypothetical protein
VVFPSLKVVRGGSLSNMVGVFPTPFPQRFAHDPPRTKKEGQKMYDMNLEIRRARWRSRALTQIYLWVMKLPEEDFFPYKKTAVEMRGVIRLGI